MVYFYDPILFFPGKVRVLPIVKTSVAKNLEIVQNETAVGCTNFGDIGNNPEFLL